MQRALPLTRRVRSAKSAPPFEPLEPRRLLAAAPVTATAADGVWRIQGTRRADLIVVEPVPGASSMLRVTAAGVEVGTHPAAGLVTLEVFAAAGADRVTVDVGGASPGAAVRVFGERGRDALTGGAGNETLDGGAGGDVITGSGGDDTLDGGPGNDVLTGGEGADSIRGGRGRDRVFRQGGVDGVARERKDRVAPDRVGALTRLDTDGAARAWFIDAAVRQYAWAFGAPAGGWVYVADTSGAVRTEAFSTGAPTAPGAAAPDAHSGAAGDGFSRTNVQEGGVDEADLVETDGRFIYTLRHPATPPPTEGSGAPEPFPTVWQDELVIADAVPADAMSVASRATVEGFAVGMYLVGDRLAVLSSIHDFGASPIDPGFERFAAPLNAAIIEPGQQRTKLTVFDVASRAAPAVVEETYLDGSYDTSRAVGDRVYVVLRNDTWPPSPAPVDAPDGGGQVYESEASYRARLAAMPMSELLPRYTARTNGSATSGALVAAPHIFVKDDDSMAFGQNMATVAVLNVGDAAAGPSGATTVAGWAGPVYASARAIYLTSAFAEGEGPDFRTGTNVFKFELAPDSVPHVATGEVDGSVLNQFSVDEDEAGRLRVATTSDGILAAGGGSTSGVYVLTQDGSDLNVIGSVTGLGRTERIRSVRFVDDTAYVVTFRQVDPLFTIDLTNPARPKVAGELKVPGFSSYLHPAGDGLLIGLGRDADDDGRVRGLQLSLFDVSKPNRPTRLDAEAIDLGGRWSGSAAEFDHHAFSYFPEQQVVAVPIDSVGDDGTPHHRQAVFKVSRENGITPSGVVSLGNFVSRSVRIGPALYGVSPDAPKSVLLESPSNVLGELSLVGPGEQ